MVVEGLGLSGFRNIDILGFILYFVVLYNYSQIHSEVFHFVRGFSYKGFHVKSWSFTCFHVLLLCH